MTAYKNKSVSSVLYAAVILSLVIAPFSAFAQDNDNDDKDNRREERHKSELGLKAKFGTTSPSVEDKGIKLRILGQKIQKNEEKFNVKASSTGSLLASSTKDRFSKPLEKAQKYEDKSMMKTAEVHLSIVVKRLEAAIERIEKLQERVSSRIDKLESLGINTTSSEQLLIESQTKLTLAKVEVKKVSDKVTEIKNSTSTSANLDEVRSLTTNAKAAIGVSYDSLLKSFTALKKTWIETRGNATTTATLNN